MLNNIVMINERQISNSNDLNYYIEQGNNAGKSGLLNESLSWYAKGLEKAKELRDQKKTNEFSALIFMLM